MDFRFLNSKNKELSENDLLILKSEKQFIPNLFKFYIKKQQQQKSCKYSKLNQSKHINCVHEKLKQKNCEICYTQKKELNSLWSIHINVVHEKLKQKNCEICYIQRSHQLCS